MLEDACRYFTAFRLVSHETIGINSQMGHTANLCIVSASNLKLTADPMRNKLIFKINLYLLMGGIIYS